MPGSERAEIYFIAVMMILILIVSFVAIYFFVKTYRKEMHEREVRLQEKFKAKAAAAETEPK